jgi:hypothetical protein
VGRDWFDFEAPTALNYDVRVTQRDIILVRKGSKLKVKKTFQGRFKNHFDPPTPVGVAQQFRGWVGVDGTLAKKKFRFVSTHLEAYSPRSPTSRCSSCWSGGPLASKKRQSILVGDYNSAPARTPTTAARRAGQRLRLGDQGRLPQHPPEAQDVLLRRGPAQHRDQPRRRGSTTCSCGRRSSC